MLVVQLALFAVSTALSTAFGIRYLACRQYMPYHAVVAGRDWATLDGGLQAVILGMLRIVGGGLLATGVATAWLMVGLYQGLAWAPWALLTLTFASTLPILYVTVWLRRLQPAARTPVLPAALALAIGTLGSALSLLR